MVETPSSPPPGPDDLGTPTGAGARDWNSEPSGITAYANHRDLPIVFATLLRSKSGGISAHRDNLIRLLRCLPEWHRVLAIDEFSQRIVCRRASPLGHAPGEEWTSDDDTSLSLWFTQQPRFAYKDDRFGSGMITAGSITPGGLDVIAEAVRSVAVQQRWHPVREYLDALQWDGAPRVDHWATRYLGAERTRYHARAGRFFLINMVRRIYEPGCVMRSVPVLEGPQNIGKSRALKALAGDWFSDTMFKIGDKDAYLAIQGVWVYEISELDAFSKAEATAVKAFISSTEDNFRAPYERRNAVHKRQTAFAATTNAAEYLSDWSGNTRFHPVACGAEIRLDDLARDRDQLLAEAVHLYRARERAYPEGEDAKLFEEEVERRLAPHPWIEKVRDYIERNVGAGGVTIGELLASGLGIDIARVSPNGLEARKVGSIMQMLGWVKARPRVEASREWRYFRPHEAPRPGRPKTDGIADPGDDVPGF